MNDYPISLVTDVFVNPQKVREFALKQDFNTTGHWHGARSKDLHFIAPQIRDHIVFTVLTQYHKDTTNVDLEVKSHFQLIPKNQRFEGFIHQDPSSLLSILYLDDIYMPGQGTSFYRLKDAFLLHDVTQIKQESFENGSISKENQQLRKKHNAQYEKLCSIENIFNSMAVFPGMMPHKADCLQHAQSDRLTVITTINFKHDSPRDRKNKLGKC